MFFFRIELSLFDEERQTVYLYPDTQALGKDETPVFQESALKSNPIFKKYVKRLKTNVVDVEYKLFATDSALPDELDDEDFNELRENGKLEELDGNEFCIIVDRAKSGGKKSGNKSMFALIVCVAAVMLLFGAMSLKKQPQDSASSGGEVSSDNSEDLSAESTEEISGDNSDISDLVDSSEDASSEESSEISDVSSEESESSESAENSDENSSEESSESGENTHDVSDSENA